MKQIMCCLVLLLSLHCFSQSKDELMVRQMLREQTESWNRGDIDGFMKGYWQSDSLMFVGKNGITYGWQNTLDHYKKGYPDTASMGKLSFDLITVKRLSFQYFYVIGKWHLQRSIGDLGGYYTLFIKKIKGLWVIVVDHTS